MGWNEERKPCRKMWGKNDKLVFDCSRSMLMLYAPFSLILLDTLHDFPHISKDLMHIKFHFVFVQGETTVWSLFAGNLFDGSRRHASFKVKFPRISNIKRGKTDQWAGNGTFH